jgi:hypothetical protein
VERLGNIAVIEQRLRKLEDGYLLMGHQLEGHLSACDKRGARLEKLAWATGAVVIISVLGLLLRAYFHFGP